MVWLISRRFSDFDQLHTRLKQQYGSIISCALPEKQWFGRYGLTISHSRSLFSITSRFDPNFLTKRQSKLQSYLTQVLRVPGILDDRMLQHFLEMEKNITIPTDGSFSFSAAGQTPGFEDDSSRRTNTDRMALLVDEVSNALIDVTHSSERLEVEQAQQRKSEILSACQGFSAVECDIFALPVHQLPVPCDSNNIGLLAEEFDRNKMNQLLDQLLTAAHAQLQQDLAIQEPSEPLIANLSTTVVN